MNHPNRSKNSPARNPRPAQIIAARELIQTARNIDITDAQIWCAELLHTSIRTWQQWETGDRRMHPSFWELFLLKAIDAVVAPAND